MFILFDIILMDLFNMLMVTLFGHQRWFAGKKHYVLTKISHENTSI